MNAPTAKRLAAAAQDCIPNKRFHTVTTFFEPEERSHFVILHGHPHQMSVSETPRGFVAHELEYSRRIAFARTPSALMAKLSK